MTREEHLKFCKECLNRRFNPQQGLTCKLTDKIADFEGNCEYFDRDESVKEGILIKEGNNIEIIAGLPEKLKEKLRLHQELVYAIAGGFFLSVICALIWAVITVGTEYQIGYMAIGVGFIVGMGVRFFGAGIDYIYGFIGAFFALLGCVLGNLFSQVGFIADAQSLGYFETLNFLDLDTILLIYQESFSFMDIVFYGIAIFEGYKFAFRPIPSDIAQREDLAPVYAKLRLPLVTISFLIVSFVGYTLSQGVNGQQTFYYESGTVMSSGEFINGKENGAWKYFYESGEPQAIAEYGNGLENGNWEWYYENAQLMRKGTYKNGLFDGRWLNYYENGILSDSSNYSQGRLDGEAITFYDNGQIFQKGKYDRDRQEGFWEIFYDNGQKNAEGNFDSGKPAGLWKYWNPNGKPLQELEYDNTEDFKIVNAWDQNGQYIVENGFGEYKSHYEDGTLLQVGRVKDGLNVGTWKTYHSNGKLKETGKYEGEVYKVLNTYSAEGKAQVIEGEGDYLTLFENSTNTFEKGQVKNGLREGYWEVYHDNSRIQQESNYIQGKLNGRSVAYYPNGNIYVEGNFVNDEKQGEWKWYYESGTIQCSVSYVYDKKEGSQIFWSESGPQSKEEIYKNDELIAEKIL